MRGFAAAFVAFASVALLAASASAKTTSAKVQVILTVSKAATVQSPADVRYDAAGRPVVSVGSFLSGWAADETAAVRLTVAPDPIARGTDVATIDF
jgi:hypothetical protein